MSKKPPPDRITLTFDLLDLPTAQHRAGLAGLILQIDAMGKDGYRRPEASIPILDEATLTATSATITFTRESMQGIFNELYAATTFDQKFPNRKKKKEVEIPEDSTELKLVAGKEKKLYVYKDAGTRPSSLFLSRHIPKKHEEASPWIEIWCRMAWEILRNEQARAPFKQVAHSGSCTIGASTWELLSSQPKIGNPTQLKKQPLNGVLLIGAQENNAEGVKFLGRVDHNILLHFWQLVVLTFVPHVVDKKEAKPKRVGYVLTIPDVADLTKFRHAFPAILQGLESEDPKHTPTGARLDLPDQACLELLRRLHEGADKAGKGSGAGTELIAPGVSDAEAERPRRNLKGGDAGRGEQYLALASDKAIDEWRKCISSVESYHMFKLGNNVKILSFARVADRPDLVADYERITKTIRNPLYRAARMRAILARRPWHWGMAELFAEYPFAFFVEGEDTPKYLPRFGRDAKVQFQTFNKDLPAMKVDEMSDDDRLNLLSLIIQRLVNRYVEGRAEVKTGKKAKDFSRAIVDGKTRFNYPTEFREAQQRVCSDAFLSIRSRHDQDFVAYFAGSICSVAQFLKPGEYQFLIKTLMTRPDPDPVGRKVLSWEDVKSIAMVAISACSFNVRPRDAAAQGSPS